MKIWAFCVFIINFSIGALASEVLSFPFVEVKTKDGQVIQGELFKIYEARWFWQNHGDKYIGIFVTGAPPIGPSLQWIAASNVASKKTLSRNSTLYKEFLVENDLVLKRFPFNTHAFVSTGNSGHHEYENMYGNFAWDLEREINGSTFVRKGLKNSYYHVFGEPVFSPVSGIIAEARGDAVDHAPQPDLSGDLSQRDQGNYVMIKMKNGFYLSLIHLKKGTIPDFLRKGVRIKAGQYLGQVGNSGITYVPHLHMTTYYWSEKLKRMISVPNAFKGGDGELMIPETGETLKSPRCDGGLLGP